MPALAATRFDAPRLLGRKRGRRVSVVVPARDEEATVGEIVARLRSLGPLVDEVLVVDDGSSDRTAAASRAAGGRVVAAGDVLIADSPGPGPGKGQALWKGLAETDGDFVVFCDADLEDFDASFVTGLLAPLLSGDDIAFVKGAYERPLAGRPHEGGRVNELVARPVLGLLFPDLAWVTQPLGGEYAGRRDVLERVPFVAGYGVDLGLLIDVAALAGPASVAQVHLGVRVHRNRPLAELTTHARAVMAVALARAGAGVAEAEVEECPPLVTVPGYRRHERVDAG